MSVGISHVTYLHEHIEVKAFANHAISSTSIHEDKGSVSDLAQWVKDPVLLLL